MEIQTNSIVSDELKDEMADLYLSFQLNRQNYAIAIKHVIEIMRVQPIIPVPSTPEYIVGVINLRGKVVPVMDMRSRFHMNGTEYDDRACIIVVSIHDSETGLLVDRVEEVYEIPSSQIQPAPPNTNNSSEKFIQGIGKIDEVVYVLLDVSHVIFLTETN